MPHVPAGVPVAPLAAAIAVLAASRAREVILSRRNEAAMRRRGGVEVAGSRLTLFAALHALLPLALVAEVIGAGARPGGLWPLWLALWIVAEWLRFASMRALGDRWSARIMVVPGEPLVRRGVYRCLAHPSYLAVTLEVLALPLLFGAWRTALVAGLANALLVLDRIRREGRALSGISGPGYPSVPLPGPRAPR
ncbi:MAG: isoprenylcysteine carboxylmethyltransferase family protein [Hyphomicrobiales bacterium]